MIYYMHKKLLSFLQKNKINFDEYKHPAVFTVKESKKIKNDIPGLHCKCLFLKDEKNEFYLIGMSAEKRLDTKKLRKYLKVRKLHFASESELLEILKLKPGSVSIFGMINCNKKNVKLILSSEVWEAEKVGFHPNINTVTIVVTHENLKKYYDSLNCDEEILEL